MLYAERVPDGRTQAMSTITKFHNEGIDHYTVDGLLIGTAWNAGRATTVRLIHGTDDGEIYTVGDPAAAELQIACHAATLGF
jgi:hypothetical protein